MPVSAVYSGVVVVVVIVTVVFMVCWSSTAIGHDPSHGFFTYEGWVKSEKEINVYVEDSSFKYEDCLRIAYAGSWPPWEKASGFVKFKRMKCKDRTRAMTYLWSRRGKPYPPHECLAFLMKIPSFWRNHKLIYDIVIALSHQSYKRDGKSKKEIYDAVGGFESYSRWIDSEKKIRFEERTNMTYEKCVKIEYARVWDEEDEAQRLSRIKCKSMVHDMFNSWVRSDEPWPPMEFFGALMKVPSFWRNHTQIYNYIIRPAQFYNSPNGGRRLPRQALDVV